MLMTVFPHGKGCEYGKDSTGTKPTRYLVRMDYMNRDKCPPEVLRGDVDVTRDLIDSLDFKWKFTAGALSWHPDDKVTPEQEQRVMDDFEKIAFAGLAPDQYNILWVRHNHAGHHELHFVIPRVELRSGNSYNPCPPGWKNYFNPMRDLHNNREGWARPDDPVRARGQKPDKADLKLARLKRWGKAAIPDERSKIKQSITDYLLKLLEQGAIQSREQVMEGLRDVGLEINRTGTDYISVKDNESGQKYRLKGGIYGEHFWLSYGQAQQQGRARSSANGDPFADPVPDLEQEFAKCVRKRTEYNRKRYRQTGIDPGAEFDLPMPEIGEPVQSPECADAQVELPAHGGVRPVPVQPDRDFPLSGNGLAAGNGRIAPRAECSGRELRPGMAAVQGAGSIRGGGKALSADQAGLENQTGRDCGGQERQRMGNRQGAVGHERTGQAPHHGIAGNEPRHAAAAGQSGPGHPAPSTVSQPDSGRAAAIRAGVARFEQYVRDLAALIDKVGEYLGRQIARQQEQERQQPQRSYFRMR